MVPVCRYTVKPLLVLATHRRQNCHVALTESARRQELGDLRWCLLTRSQDQQPYIRLDERDHLFHRPAMHRQGLQIRHAPAHTGRGQLERRYLRVVRNFVRWNAPPDPRADREPQRVPRRQHDNPFAAPRLQFTDQRIEGRGPFQHLRHIIRRQYVVAPTTYDDFGRLDNRAGGGGQAVQPVLADTNDM